MPDQSFKCWHVAVNCDHPKHVKNDPQSNDWESVEPELTRELYREEMREAGWVFHADGRTTCPKCAKKG